MQEDEIPSETGWRGSADVWLQAAYEALVGSGVDAVRIQPLAKALNLSRTSFYWFFKDRQALLDSLVARWKTGNTGNLVARAGAYAQSVNEGILNVFDCFFDTAIFDSDFEFAMRSWAVKSIELAGAVNDADDTRIAAIAAMFIRFGYGAASADVRARALYLTQIGYISLKPRETRSERMGRIAEYVMIFSGQYPDLGEMQRFFARHGFIPDAAMVASIEAMSK